MNKNKADFTPAQTGSSKPDRSHRWRLPGRGAAKEGMPKRSVFRNLALSMIGFGILIGIIFPPFARVVLDSERALSLQFFAMCIFAGFLVGIVNYYLFNTVVSRQLDQIALGMERVLNNLVATQEVEVADPKAYQLDVTSADAIGEIELHFNDIAARLRGTLARLNRRTRALQTSAEVSRSLSTILDQANLVNEVVGQLQSAFHYYHVHIYLYDESQEYLVMAGGTGEVGRAMLNRGHKLLRGKGLVGRAAETRQVVLVPDVSRDPGWLPNPLLPDTKSEVAVPIILGERVLGVLDVQQHTPYALGQDDAELLQTIAGQAAVALQNARVYQQVQRRAEREAQGAEISQKIQRSRTIEEVLKVSIAELGGALAVPRACGEIHIQTTRSADFRLHQTEMPNLHVDAHPTV